MNPEIQDTEGAFKVGQIEYADKLSELKGVYLQYIEHLNKTSKDTYNLFADKGYDFVNELAKQYGKDKLRDVALFHLLVGSSQPKGVALQFDLPQGEFEAFIRALLPDLEKYEQEHLQDQKGGVEDGVK